MSARRTTFLRALVSAFPPLRLALKINDYLCYVLQLFVRCILKALQCLYWLVGKQVSAAFKCLNDFLSKVLPTRETEYKRLDGRQELLLDEASQYRQDSFRSRLVYQGSMVMGAALFVFVYFVLIKHHSYITISVGVILFFAYLIIIENSHSIRSILMLCLPIMFTNRGRALIFCSMLAMTTSGPIRNIQLNSGELRSSLTCCKQYLIIKTDRFVDKNVVQNLVSVEDLIVNLVEHIKEFAREVKDKVRALLEMAITIERYMILAINKLAEVVNRCNARAQEMFRNCIRTFDDAYTDCRNKLGTTFDFLCQIVKPVKEVCHVTKFPDSICDLPEAVFAYLDRTIGKQLRHYIRVLENEFYVDIDVEHSYSLNATKTKSLRQVYEGIKYDVELKFWYISLVTKVFNLVSLILVIWILYTATMYHMHFITEIKYDNMYIDNYLTDIDKKNRENNKLGALLFPISASHQKYYLKPFSLRMNESEEHKLYLAGLVWLVIMGFVFFFVAADYSLSKLIGLINLILDEIFKSDLSLVDIRASGYNRTYLKSVRFNSTSQLSHRLRPSTTQPLRPAGTLSGLYRRLLDSIESNIPDDLSMLSSLLECQPVSSAPLYPIYLKLAYLAAITFVTVIVEAYALRTRHCIANLFYPRRAKHRAAWLYRKMIDEKPKYEHDDGSVPGDDINERSDNLVDASARLLLDGVKHRQ